MAVLAQVIPVGYDVAAISAYLAAGAVVVIGVLLKAIWGQVEKSREREQADRDRLDKERHTALVSEVQLLRAKQHEQSNVVQKLVFDSTNFHTRLGRIDERLDRLLEG